MIARAPRLIPLLLLASAATASAQVLRYDGDPGASRGYVREQRDRVVQTIDGRQAVTDIESHWRLRASILRSTPGELTIRVVHDSLAITGAPGTEGLDLAALHGVPIAVVMTPEGVVRRVELPDTLPPAAARLDLDATYRSFFPRLPGGEAAEGHAWSDTVRVQANQNGLDVRVLRVNRYVSKGWATVGDARVARVDYEADLSIEGEGEQGEAEVVLSGTGRASGSFDFDPEAGAYLGGSETSEMRMVALVSAEGQNVLIPIVQNRTETVSSDARAAPAGG